MSNLSHILKLLETYCVRLKADRYDSQLPEMREWCLREFGEERPSFPISEVEFEGEMDYFDGDWCQDTSSRYSDDGNREIIFWFWKRGHKTKFQLTWV
jgi:hypothetical protein